MNNEFIVGEFFTEEVIKQKLFPNGVLINELFINKLITPNKEKIITIDENIGRLRICNIPEPLNGSDTQKYTESAPLTENELFQILYLLICDFNDDKSQKCLEIIGTKYYYTVSHHFHVKLSSGELISISLSQFGPFYLTACEFDGGVSGGMFCYLNFFNGVKMKTSNKNDLKNELFSLIKSEVINQLNGVSNQNAEVPIPNHDYVSVKNLINEVETETLIGMRYMIEWAKTIAVITKIRRTK